MPIPARKSRAPRGTSVGPGRIDHLLVVSSMERIEVGMHVDIKRSDGRVHGSVVTELRPERNMVMVEWFEHGETKGKEVDLKTLLDINPTLKKREVKPEYRAPPENVLSFFNDENETLDDIKLPPPRRSVAAQIQQPRPSSRNVVNNRHSMVDNGSGGDLSNFENGNAPVRRLQPPTKTTAPRTQITNGSNASSAATTPLDAPITRNNVMVRSVDRLDDADTTIVTSDFDVTKKSSTVQNVERLQKEREDRRAQQDKIRKQKEAERALDPGNTNYPFFAMIRDYRANIDYRPLKMTDNVIDARISVCVRKRPMNKKENTKKEVEVVTIPNRDHIIVHQPQVKVDLTKYLENQKFRFDYAFDENTSNEMVYKFTAQPLIRTIFEKGFATCFAYGQTGSGKTHTMGGDFTAGKTQNCSGGIYALTAADVFKLRNREFRNAKLDVLCCYFEIYGGKVFDLLNNKSILRVLEDGKKEVNVVGLREELVENEDDVLDIIKRGTELRTAGSTSANSNSSRSHAVFQIILRQNKKLWGKFSLIDLAGNERGQDTGNSDRQTRMEGAEINKSLLALKECIRAMAKNSNHVPFRTSKLTLVLRDSFVGENAKTCMIAMISPGMSSCEHTINTLRYADRVKELGADDGETEKPLDDEDFMLQKDDDEEDELNIVCNRNGVDKKQAELLKIGSKIAATEETTIGIQMDLQTVLPVFVRQFEAVAKQINKVDYDQEKYVKDALSKVKNVKTLLDDYTDNLESWQKLLQKEADMSKDVNGRAK